MRRMGRHGEGAIPVQKVEGRVCGVRAEGGPKLSIVVLHCVSASSSSVPPLPWPSVLRLLGLVDGTQKDLAHTQ